MAAVLLIVAVVIWGWVTNRLAEDEALSDYLIRSRVVAEAETRGSHGCAPVALLPVSP